MSNTPGNIMHPSDLKKAWVLPLLGLLLSCSSKTISVQGYVEGDYVYVSPYVSGQLTELSVQRGDSVTIGQSLFKLDPEPLKSELQAAQAAEVEAAANLQNLQTGSRPSELAEIEAQIKQAQAQLIYASKEKQRNRTLLQSSSVSQDALDLATQNASVAMNLMKQYQASLETAKLPARDAQLKAAEAALQQSIAEVSQAKWMFQQTSINSPVTGVIFDIYHFVGEQALPGQPVLVILPPDHVKAIFYVPETLLSNVKIGEQVAVSCNSCQKPVNATIRFISPNAEYTPPVLYSRDSQSQLMYRVEASFEKDSLHWHPGQPLTITFSNVRSAS